MRDGVKKVGRSVLVAALAVVAYAALAPNAAIAGKGGGKGGGPPPPPPCDCPEVIELPDGTVCILDDCGSDCSYVCPFPG